MIRSRGMKFRDPDDAFEYFEQRDVDDQAALQDAHVAGRQAGMLDVPAGANPYELGSQAAAEWERARRAVEAMKRSEDLKRRARTLCQPCTCGGRGLCLEDAE